MSQGVNLWLKTSVLVGVLLAILLGAAAVSRAPTIGGHGTRPKIPAFIRTGQAEPAISAEAVMVKRLKNGAVLFEQRANDTLPIASLTKLMTALLLAEASSPLTEVVFSAEAKHTGEQDEKRSAVPAGERLKAEDVIKMLLISSDSDAAYAAGEAVATKREPTRRALPFAERMSFFVALMNERARTLGLASTHFANPTGSDHPDNSSTAHDVTELAEFITRDQPELWTVSRTQETFIFGTGGARYGLVNTNPLLKEYPAIYGSKTGFTDAAGGTLLLLYQIAPADFLSIVLLRSEDRFGDSRALIRWIESSFTLETQ